MKRSRTIPILLLIAAALPPQMALAQVAPEAVSRAVDHPAAITKHHGTFNGHTIDYTATVEGLVVTSGPRQSSARVVSFAYTRDGADRRTRPVIFLFNGGPIVSSPYVHIGGLGPKRVAFPDDVTADPASFQLVDNPYSPLDAADLVFVDPASTGFSRVMAGTQPSDYYSIPADAAQFAAFIRTWLRTNGREGAPVYLFGESYGTNRAAAIAGALAEGPDPLPLAGVFIYGQALNIIEYSQRPGNIVSYVASLPTVAAIGWYHQRVEHRGRTLDQFLAEVRSFAKGDYLAALYRGDDLPPDARRSIAVRLQAFSGIPADWYLANGLRITKERYRTELLKDRGLLLGRSDARYTAPITDRGEAPDPSGVLGDAIQRIFPAYIKSELGVDWTDPYVLAAPITSLEDWGWGFGTSPFGDWPYQLGITRMMTFNPRFRLVVGNGVYDTQTTMGAAEYLVTQSGWDRARVTLRYYDGGHMGYSVAATAKAIGDDIRTLVR
ncbi:MAG TPA: peptidase S10 [Sphingobium sp.]|uniref:S10 family peptidase n=1 Tax=Sphingobium sp. TaxID=1912891 RepID=UPI002ED024A6